MKKYILILFFCLATNCFAQTFMISQIKNTKWRAEGRAGDGKEWIFKFSDKYFYDITTFYFNKKTYIIKNPYYLSSYIPDKFDASLVGKNTKGKYVIYKVTKDLCWFELLGFRIGKLIIKLKTVISLRLNNSFVSYS